jgi:hypothetical protein
MGYETPTETGRVRSRCSRAIRSRRQACPAVIALAAIALIALGTPRASSGFLPPLNFEPGAGPVSVAVGDFNSDGILDLKMPGCAQLRFGNGKGIPTKKSP